MKENHGQYLKQASGGLRQYLADESPFSGVVIDDDDPERRGRLRVRVPVLHGTSRDMPDDTIPWATNTEGNSSSSFTTPELGKVVLVDFPHGDLYHPLVSHTEHKDPSLQQKLDEYRGDSARAAYRSFKALSFNSSAQVWHDRDTGFVMDYNMSQINIDAERNIHVELQAPDARLNLVHRDSDQNLINGPNFMQWMDEFIQNLMGTQLGPYVGNLAAPVLPNPAFLQVCNKYFALRDSKFLNWYAFVRDNVPWEPLQRISWEQVGDDTSRQTRKPAASPEPDDRISNETQGIDLSALR